MGLSVVMSFVMRMTSIFALPHHRDELVVLQLIIAILIEKCKNNFELARTHTHTKNIYLV